MNNEEIIEEQTEEVSEPAKIEKVTLSDISSEKVRQDEEKSDELVRRIMKKILEIK